MHAETDDARGIDVVFLYDATLFQVPLPLEESVFFNVVMRRRAAREIVQRLIPFRGRATDVEVEESVADLERFE